MYLYKDQKQAKLIYLQINSIAILLQRNARVIPVTVRLVVTPAGRDQK